MSIVKTLSRQSSGVTCDTTSIIIVIVDIDIVVGIGLASATIMTDFITSAGAGTNVCCC